MKDPDLPQLLMLVRVLHKKGLLPTCITCTNFEAGSETCKLTNPPMRPPAPVIAQGCGQWDEGLPF